MYVESVRNEPVKNYRELGDYINENKKFDSLHEK